MTAKKAFLTTVVLATLALAPAAADVIELTDGSRLLGTIVRMQDGKLILETQFAGTLEIDASLIKTIQTAEPVNVGVDTGDRLVGPIEWQSDLERPVVQTELGGVPVDLPRISAIWPKDGKSPEALALEQQIEQAKAEIEAQRAKWSATFEAGLSYQEGNTKAFEARGRGELRRTGLKDLLRFYLSGRYVERNRVRDTAEFIFGTFYQYLLTERFFPYGRLELEYDEFENIELRATAIVGVGYYWIKKDNHELKNLLGVGYLHESFLTDKESRNAAQAEVGVAYRLDIAPWVQFVHATSWFPTFESLEDYRIVSDTGFIFPINGSDMWKFKLGAQYQYKSIPVGDADRLDQTYYANILIDVK